MDGQSTIWTLAGVLVPKGRAEIIPVEPDPDNAGAGKPTRCAPGECRGAFFYSEEMGVELIVNGEAYEAKQPESVAALLEEMGIGGRPVVVVLNDEVIPASSRSTCGLREGDSVELFRLVGGG